MNEQEKKRLEMLEASEKKLKDRYKYQNEYIKNNYDKIVLTLPKGFKKEVDNIAKNKGFKTITEYLKALIDSDLKSPESLNEITADPQQDHTQI